jgi:O-antigen/teichoic acid export membrane protein
MPSGPPDDSVTQQLTAVGRPDLPPPGPPAGSPPGVARENGGIGDGLALSISSALGSVAGLLTWLIAAWIMPQAEVGRATEFVSAFQLIGGVAQLNLGVGLLRWLPNAGRLSTRLVWGSLLLIMPLSGLVGLVYGVIVPSIAETASGDQPWGVGLVLLVLACAGWGVFVVHDFIVVALGRPWIAVWRNGTFAVVRIGMLLLLGSAYAAEGMVLSWVVPIVIWIAIGSGVVYWLTRRYANAHRGGTLPSRADMARFLGPTALAQLGNALLYNQVPLLVNLRLGNEAGAAFFICWQAVTVVDIAAVFFMNSLAVHTAREPHRAAELARQARRRMLMLFLPILALGAVLGHPVLSILGEGYAAAAPALAILMIGLAFRLVVVFDLAQRQARGDGMGFAKVQLTNTGLILALTAFVPLATFGEVPLDTLLMPIVLSYVVVQALCALFLFARPALRRWTSPEVKS